MKYDIYFHNDFDGRASAAVALSFFRSRGDDIEHFVPVDFYLENEWMREDFLSTNKLVKGRHNPAVVVDFLYNPGAAFWFDHHPTSIRKEAWRKRFKRSKFFVLEPQRPSCARVVASSLSKNFGWRPPRVIRDLVRSADIIDGALFKNVGQTITLRDPAMEVDAFIDATSRNKELARSMVELMASKPLEEIAAMPRVRRVADKIRAKNLIALRFYRKNLKAAGNATFIDLTRNHEMMLRFAPYYLMPSKRYSIRLVKKDGEYKVSVSGNQWLKNGSQKRKGIHIGNFLSAFGGGGHKGAGGANFASRKEAEKALAVIIKKFAAAGA